MIPPVPHGLVVDVINGMEWFLTLVVCGVVLGVAVLVAVYIVRTIRAIL